MGICMSTIVFDIVYSNCLFLFACSYFRTSSVIGVTDAHIESLSLDPKKFDFVVFFFGQPGASCRQWRHVHLQSEVLFDSGAQESFAKVAGETRRRVFRVAQYCSHVVAVDDQYQRLVLARHSSTGVLRIGRSHAPIVVRFGLQSHVVADRI